jgi:hypothetical protein
MLTGIAFGSLLTKYPFMRTLPRLARPAFFLLLSISLLLAPNLGSGAFTKGRQVAPLTGEFKPGDYTWHPQISPSGPVVILISIPAQMMYVYRNGVCIGRSTVSTGAKGHTTPTGVFTVLQKKVDHTSSIYKGAKMPHMQRLTWTGIAMHAGQLPGYPASHGCVRLPEDFAEKLYSVTSLGTTVIITSGKPSERTTPGLVFIVSKNDAPPRGAVVWRPELAPAGPVSIVFSAADGRAYVYRNGVEIGRAPVRGYGLISGTHAYSALATVDSRGRRDWITVASVGGRTPNIKELAEKIDIDPQFLANVRALVAPGASLIITDGPVDGATRSDPDFNIMTGSN